MTDINNISIYNTEMNKAMLDKVFFMDKIDAPHIFDFGCADGAMIKYTSNIFPAINYYGYDESTEMIGMARKNIRGAYTDNLDEFLGWAAGLQGKKAIVFNSVLHEIFNYKTRNEVTNLFLKIQKIGFDYIAIRDMFFDNKENFPKTEYDKLEDLANLFRFGDKEHIIDFEKQKYNAGAKAGFFEFNTDVVRPQDQIHFLLKYRYNDNWDREVKENYFANSDQNNLLDTLYGYLADKNLYKVTMREHFIPAFIKDSVKKDFKIDINHNTHVKILLEKK